MNALGWGLVHFLWQGAVVGLITALVTRTAASPRLRHGVAVAGLASMVICFAVTVGLYWPGEVGAAAVGFGDRRVAAATAGAYGRVAWDWRLALPWMTRFWVVGVVGLGLYRLGGWWMTRRLRRCGVCAVGAAWQERLSTLARRMGVGQAVEMFESSLVEVPVVIGWLRPVLLMPVGMMASMPVGQVEAILLHELAHVFRRDAAVNVLQSVAESLLFYHPAVWWVSGVIREEREKCCDDLVVALQGDAREYATALLTLEERRADRLEPALAANGGDLMKRIERLLKGEAPRAGWAGLLAPVVVLVVLSGLAGLAQELKGPYLNWLTQDVVYIIEAKEKDAYLALGSDEEREKFIEQFWQRRDPKPETAENEFKLEHYRRIKYSDERFSSAKAGWRTDLGRVYIKYGPPDEIEIHMDKKQNWLYRHIAGIGENVVLSFTYQDGEYVWDTELP